MKLGVLRGPTRIATFALAVGGGHHAVQSVRSCRRSFERQKGFDFWLEGRRLGDFRRNLNNVNDMPVSGDPYFKPGFPPIGNKTCYPLPLAERDNNPNF